MNDSKPLFSNSTILTISLILGTLGTAASIVIVGNHIVNSRIEHKTAKPFLTNLSATNKTVMNRFAADAASTALSFPPWGPDFKKDSKARYFSAEGKAKLMEDMACLASVFVPAGITQKTEVSSVELKPNDSDGSYTAVVKGTLHRLGHTEERTTTEHEPFTLHIKLLQNADTDNGTYLGFPLTATNYHRSVE